MEYCAKIRETGSNCFMHVKRDGLRKSRASWNEWNMYDCCTRCASNVKENLGNFINSKLKGKIVIGHLQ